MKFALPVAVVLRFRSLPVRGAWIEIYVFVDFAEHLEVAPRKGSVD